MKRPDPSSTHIRLHILSRLSPTDPKSGEDIRAEVAWVPSVAAFLNMLSGMDDCGYVDTYRTPRSRDGHGTTVNEYTITARGRRVLEEAVAFYADLSKPNAKETETR
jgi:DNA-binding PadR family transcriptional regulator